MIIAEFNAKNDNKKEKILEIKNINGILNDDGIFHTILIFIDIKAKNIYFEVDNEKIKIEDNNSHIVKYIMFEFNEFNVLIGYRPLTIKLKLKNNKYLSTIPIIDINNILITKFKIVEEYNSFINIKNNFNLNEILTENINKNKKYLLRNKTDRIPENIIIADINFKNKNINIINLIE